MRSVRLFRLRQRYGASQEHQIGVFVQVVGVRDRLMMVVMLRPAHVSLDRLAQATLPRIVIMGPLAA
jgi:hypothetical protein